MEILENARFPDLFISSAFLIASLIIKHSVGEERLPKWSKPSDMYKYLKFLTDAIIGAIPYMGYFLMCLTNNNRKIILFTLLIELVIWCEAKTRKKALAILAKNMNAKTNSSNSSFKDKVSPYVRVFWMIMMAVLLFIILYYFATTNHVISNVKNYFIEIND